jgi:CheY-like chemotaxis protein
VCASVHRITLLLVVDDDPMNLELLVSVLEVDECAEGRAL